MRKHKLIELQKVIEEKIGSLKEEIEIGTKVKSNALYIADQQDEIQFLQWTTRIIQSILNRDCYERQQGGAPKKRLEIMDTIEFENMLQERIEELNFKLKDSNKLQESDFLINEIDVLESILGRLSDLGSPISSLSYLDNTHHTMVFMEDNVTVVDKLSYEIVKWDTDNYFPFSRKHNSVLQTTCVVRLSIY